MHTHNNYENISIRTRKRPLPFLLLSIASIISLSSIVILLPPNLQLSIFPTLVNQAGSFQSAPFSISYLFFFLLFLFLFSTTTYLFKSKKHGVIVALFVIIYLLFRLNNLTHPFFLILLLALFLTIELLFSYRKK